jgi:type IV pilus assembly protein PilO
MTLDDLRALDPRDPGRWPLAVRLGTIAIAFVVISLVLLYLLVWSSKKDELAGFEQQEQTLRAMNFATSMPRP